MTTEIDPKVRELAEKVIAARPNSRGARALAVMLDKGAVSTADLRERLDHPPRAIADAKDAGVPIKTTMVTVERDGRKKRISLYSFGSSSEIQDGRIGGRSVLPKAFKQKLLDHYGSRDCISGARLDSRVLQIDHRIPYRIAGDAGLAVHDVSAYMLLDASNQRGKSWSCEQCPNMKPDNRDPVVCGSCFWAYPENYSHIATQEMRRTDVIWVGADVAVHDAIRDVAKASGADLSELLRQLAKAKLKDV
ncbi:MAG: hypothetical protein Q8R82_13330 [Hyphomonadaceae bacterium]|nr:hypothetical protein [Hyphomonadaceae bacterium]